MAPVHSPKRPYYLAAMLLVAALLMSGCGSRGASYSEASAPQAIAVDGYTADQAAPMEYAAAEASAGAAAPEQPGTTSALLNRQMVARASIALVVANADEAVRSIETIMQDVGGFISTANLYNQYSGDTPVLAGNVTLRVPAEALEQTMTRLEGLALQVGSRTITREDVTDQYTDLDAQLRNLQATEEELRAMLTEVREKPNATPEDILAVHNRLTEIRGQIEQVQGRKNMLDNLIGLSTIEVSLSPDAASLPVVETGWRPAAEFRSATRSLVSGLQTLGTALIWFVVAVVPVLLLIALPFVLLFFIARGIYNRRRRRKAAATA
jgi:hypothetical protein